MIDPTTFEYGDSRWEDIYNHLKSKGFEVYSPGQHEGECLSNYIVVKFDGTSNINNVSSRRDLYAILCYVPKDRYSELDKLVQQAREAMKELKPLFMQYDEQQSISSFDEAARAHYVSVEYCNIKKN